MFPWQPEEIIRGFHVNYWNNLLQFPLRNSADGRAAAGTAAPGEHPAGGGWPPRGGIREGVFRRGKKPWQL